LRVLSVGAPAASDERVAQVFAALPTPARYERVPIHVLLADAPLA
jgi:hypothetical protein